MAEAELVPPDGDRPKRRLPIVPSEPSAQEPQDAERPPWHWSAIGMVAIFLCWLPLATGAQALAMRALGTGPDAPPEAAPVAMIAPHAVAFVLASFAGGLLVGRFGNKAGSKEAAIGGFLASSLAWALAAAQPAQGTAAGPVLWGLILIVLASLGSAVAYAGGRTGVRVRPPDSR